MITYFKERRERAAEAAKVQSAKDAAAAIAKAKADEATKARQAVCIHQFYTLTKDSEYVPVIRQINPYVHSEFGPKCRTIKTVLYCPICDLTKEPW